MNSDLCGIQVDIKIKTTSNGVETVQFPVMTSGFGRVLRIFEVSQSSLYTNTLVTYQLLHL